MSSIGPLAGSASYFALRPAEALLRRLIPARIWSILSPLLNVAKVSRPTSMPVELSNVGNGSRATMQLKHAPVSVFTFDCECFYLALEFPIQLNLDVADFGQLQLSSKSEPCLWIRQRIVPMLSLKSREAWCLVPSNTKEE